MVLALLIATVPEKEQEKGRLLAPVLASVAALVPLAVAVSRLVSGLTAHGSLPWFMDLGASLSIDLTIDRLSAVMLAAIAVTAVCVTVFSVGYLREEMGWPRYFALIALFIGSINLLVCASTLTALFIGWELVSLCSYLFIGFWYKKKEAAQAAVKAFVTARVGDVGLLLGMALLWSHVQSDSFAEIFAAVGKLPVSVCTAAALAIAVGAMGKAAQFPLQAWLPDAMEGPTPASALTHAATMAASGVYLVARMWPLFDAAPVVKGVLLAVGLISALGGALAASAQADIKKVLAYAMVSQLGSMFVVLGTGMWPVASFHLMVHAAFTALLLLAAGSVIHGVGTQDLSRMGGLCKAMPVTFAVWLVGIVVIVGIPPFDGFFGADPVISGVFHASVPVGIALLAANGITAFYAARVTRLVFFDPQGSSQGTLRKSGSHTGASRKDVSRKDKGTSKGKAATRAKARMRAKTRAHESPALMLGPLLALALGATGLGFASIPLLRLLGEDPMPFRLGVAVAAFVLHAAGAFLGWRFAAVRAVDSADANAEGGAKARFGLGGSGGDGGSGLGRLLENGWNWDAVVDRVVVRPVIGASRALWAIGDRLIAEWIAEGPAVLSRAVGRSLSGLQTGDAQAYAVTTVVAFIVLLVVSIWVGRW